MKRLLILMAGITALSAVLLVACGGSDDDASPAPAATVASTVPPAPPAPAAMTIAVSSSVPWHISKLYISKKRPDAAASPNSTPTIIPFINNMYSTNADTAPHTFTIDTLVDSGRIEGAGRGAAQFTPSQAGVLTFYCTIHGRERMSGTLTVSAGASVERPDTSDGQATLDVPPEDASLS